MDFSSIKSVFSIYKRLEKNGKKESVPFIDASQISPSVAKRIYTFTGKKN